MSRCTHVLPAGRRRTTGTADAACAAGTAAASPDHHLSISGCGAVGERKSPHLAVGAGGAMVRSRSRCDARATACASSSGLLHRCGPAAAVHTVPPRRADRTTGRRRRTAALHPCARCARHARRGRRAASGWRDRGFSWSRNGTVGMGERGAARPGNAKSRRRWSARGDVLGLRVRASGPAAHAWCAVVQLDS